MYEPIKRALDIGLTSLLLVPALPVLGLAVLAIKLDSPGPFLFKQERLGRHARLFCIYKLRTMTHEYRKHDQQIMPGSSQVTRVGALLRRLKIDELPQLFNVLLGDMSLVGPRPAMPTLLEELDELGRERLDARPGLTGLAQVNGNIYLSWPERWKLDAHYVRNVSLGLDLKILARTAAIVLLGEEWGKA